MTARIFDRAFAWRLTSRQAANASAILAAAATREHGAPARVVGIARGGLVPARVIARLTGAPLSVITAAHNPTDAAYAQATGQVTRTASTSVGPLSGLVFVVDDICGSGATLQAVTADLAALAGPGTAICTMTLCRNAGAAIRPDFTIWDDLREWVIFPWERGPHAALPTMTLPGPARAVRP